VVDLSAPGEYYVKNLEDVTPELLDEKGDGDYFLITVTCPSSNVDNEASEQECAKHNCDSVVMIKDDTQCQIVDVKPFKN
jgi:hypothetical protein